MMAALATDLWSLVKGRPEVDPHDLAKALEDEVHQQPLDYRTRLLIRDSAAALRKHWGEERFASWLATSPARTGIESIQQERFERPGFGSLEDRLVEKTDLEDIRQYLRDLGSKLNHTIRLDIGGSAALLLPGHLVRKTDDIDVVDEVPAEIRTQHELLAQLKKRYGLELAHFQRHYLPMRWEQRLHSLGSFGRLQIYSVDPPDVFLSKLFSIREKDLDDLRVLSKQFDKTLLARRLLDTMSSALAAPELRKRAEHNWYILYGEPLPT